MRASSSEGLFFAYADLNPISYSDPMGLYTKDSGFSQPQGKAIDQALDDIEQRLSWDCPKCVPEETGQAFKQLIDSDIHFVLDQSLKPCAIKFKGNNKIIHVSPEAFKKGGKCCKGNLAAILAHEMAHILWPDEPEHADTIEKVCFGCQDADSH